MPVCFSLVAPFATFTLVDAFAAFSSPARRSAIPEWCQSCGLWYSIGRLVGVAEPAQRSVVRGAFVYWCCKLRPAAGHTKIARDQPEEGEKAQGADKPLLRLAGKGF